MKIRDLALSQDYVAIMEEANSLGDALSRVILRALGETQCDRLTASTNPPSAVLWRDDGGVHGSGKGKDLKEALMRAVAGRRD